jgi:hypothetical protein
MKTGTKVGIGIGAVAAIVGGYFLWTKVIKPKRDEKKNEETKPPSEVSSNIENYKPSKGSSGSSSSGISVPFKNTEEGNHFRNWINDTYAAYAKKIDLDRSGSYNNSYIKKAWKEYGEVYQKAIKDGKAAEAKKAAEIKVGDWTMTDNNKGGLSSKKQLTFSRPTMVSNDFRGREFGIPNTVKFKVKRTALAGATGRKMCYIFNESYKPRASYSKGVGFQVYCSYLKKVKFAEFSGAEGYNY